MKYGKNFWTSKINWIGLLAMAEAVFQFWYTYKEVEDWSPRAMTQFVLGAALIAIRTGYTNKPIK